MISLNQHLENAGLDFARLQTPEGLAELDRRFLDWLGERDAELRDRLLATRDRSPEATPAYSGLLLAVAPHLEQWLAGLFGITEPLTRRRAELAADDVIVDFKREFVQKRARKARPEDDFTTLDAELTAALRRASLPTDLDEELAVARYGLNLLGDEQTHEEAIRQLADWCARALETPEGRARVAGWSAFRLPRKVDHARLVPLRRADLPGAPRLEATEADRHNRDGFSLTDARMSARDVHAEAHYCVLCHDHAGDFCSRGFPEKKKQPELGFRQDPLGNTLTGCPLEEKIGEMNALRREGRVIAALAMIMVDNPMVPATGHRICNDCMKSCIYQKQDPVDIPQAETGVLTEVLDLPWGVELYHLLARWNPLRPQQYLQQPHNGRRVLVAGMGPAGFTMAHHLTMAGCKVVGIDGLKVEPLPEDILKGPVRDWGQLAEDLDERILLGFGGVAEYGITVRWDKNFLKLIYLTLARRQTFSVHGGVRLGGTLTLEDAWEQGFDHVCVATGAGYPRVIPMGNSLARGMRQANDFLMALQLTGAGKMSSIATLQVRLPAVVIGGGLTGVDTATEVQAYYIRQVEKVLWRYETLVAERGEEAVRGRLGEEDQTILDEFLAHGRAAREERERAAAEDREPDFVPLIQQWGGVTIAYRKGMNASPAYTRNHEELRAATEEGLYYAEGLDPIHARLDEHQHIRSLVCRQMKHDAGRWFTTNNEVELPARSVFVAAGTVPNTIYEHEHPGSLELEDNHYRTHAFHSEGLQPVQKAEHVKSPEVGPFTGYRRQGRTVTFLGDTHPVYQGSVVRAIASARDSWPEVMKALDSLPARVPNPDPTAFQLRISDLLRAEVVSVNRDNPAVTELWVRAPAAARRFRPGQFFRLQTYESYSPLVAGTRLQVPILTVSGTGIDGDCIRLMVFQWGAGPRIAGRLQPGDPVVLMGPTGAATDIPSNETVLVVAGRWGAAVMHDIGSALRAAGNRVLYLAAFGSPRDVDHQEELEAGADQIIWCTAGEALIPARRPGDCAVQATDMLDVLRRYGDGEIQPAEGRGLPLSSVDRILVMGGTGLLKGFQAALEDHLGGRLAPGVQAHGTVGSPMQCMLKGVCAQCLQWQVDPETGKRTRPVFSCAEQDQPLAWIDLDNLAARQQQNRLLDQLTGQWVDYVLKQAES